MGSKIVGNSKGSHSGGGKGISKGQNIKIVQRGSFKSMPISESRVSEQSARLEGEGVARPTVQCWGCGGPHYVKNCPRWKGTEQISQIHEASTVGNVGHSVPRINATLTIIRWNTSRPWWNLKVKFRPFYSCSN